VFQYLSHRTYCKPAADHCTFAHQAGGPWPPKCRCQATSFISSG
jgi:hypothetical protein